MDENFLEWLRLIAKEGVNVKSDCRCIPDRGDQEPSNG